jgi:hypothetical protein
MQSSTIFTVFLIFLISTTVVYADHVTSDYDRHIRFEKFKTFMWVQEPQTDEPFMKERLMAAVNTQLTNRGLIVVNEGADCVVDAALTIDERRTWQTYYDSFGWDWGWDYSGWATTTEITFDVATITVDLFDSHTNKLAWRGTATDEVSHHPEKRSKNIRKEIEKMFRGFPPVRVNY